MRPRIRASIALTAALLCAGGVVAATPAAASSAATATATATATAELNSGADWTVEAVDGGYLVTKTVQNLPERSAAPVLWADGVALGFAVRTPDGTALTTTTGDERVLTADEVLVGWSGEGDPADRSASLFEGRGSADDPAPVPGTQAAAAPPLEVDPGASGPYSVLRADYDLGDEAEPIFGFRGARGEMRAAVYLPDGAVGELPVVVFLHGQHVACLSDDPKAPPVWPCAAGETEIPSYLGYGGPAEALASQGYAVVSISANAINRLNGLYTPDQGTDARGHLVLDHLELLRRADAGPVDGIGSALVGRLDLNRVGLMGHSRGGDGIVRAAVLNASTLTGPAGAADAPFGIEALLPLAPTDFTRTAVPDVPMAVLLPYCDGDLSDLQGQHYINDSRYAFGDDVLRSSVLVLGANHNFFNTVWTPELYPAGASDDWAANPVLSDDDPVCGSAAAGRLSATEQYAVGTAYVAGFFRLTVGGETDLVGQFDGSDARPASAGRADVRVTATYPASDRLDLNTFAHATVPVTTTGSAQAEYCESAEHIAVATELPFCVSGNLYPEQAGEFTGSLYGGAIPATPSLRLSYSAEPQGRAEAASLVVAAPGGTVDASGASFLTVRAMPDETVTASTALTVTVRDADGATASVEGADFGSALSRLPGESTPLPKMLYQDLRIPVSAFPGIDLRRISAVQLTGAGTGGVLLSDLAFVGEASVGTAAVVPRAQASVRSVQADLGATASGAASIEVPIVLPRAATETVRGWLSDYTSPEDFLARDFTVTTGERCVAVTVPVSDARLPDPGGSSAFGTGLGYLTGGGVAGEAFASVHLRDPGAVVTDDVNTLPLGTQGDACAEALAQPVLLAAPGTAPAGGVIDVSAEGYRAGEGVTVQLAGLVIGTGIADASGSLRASVALPADSAAADTALAAVGAGSGHRAAATLQVTAAVGPTPAPTPTPAPAPAPAPSDGGAADAAGAGGPARLAATGGGTIPPSTLLVLTLAAATALAAGTPLLLPSRRRRSAP
ncbi:hypothetical protein [Herbiconiux sp. YIM B11900]|uniref:hypothetical protein n=1 Tax=Herbiconiux sp. YIM B11900 TaxID=3404131 RepID=UPI003F834A9A